MQSNFFKDGSSKIHSAATQFVEWLDSTGRCGFKRTQKEIEAYFSRDFKYSVNDNLVAQDAQSLCERFVIASKKYELSYIHFPLLEALQVSDNLATAKFKVTFIEKYGERKDTVNTIQIKFEQDGKVKEFLQSFNPPMSKTPDNEILAENSDKSLCLS
ncbi:hypothetical protein [Legionella sainthelensi]|uniref:Uncharacterized protein n=1 Tax=Legionella sainthelensi TaxID=28087 RepID=A0A2H5FPI1_9GAMM|nr:hypothetical protein [Legionella sainthelensi]AUH73403.1 hypothetical protein CAB17_16090 [Legionella sainthelensi]